MYNNSNYYYDNLYQPYYRESSNAKMSYIDLNNLMRQLWGEHVMWTKLAIMSIDSNSPDAEIVSNRLLRNPNDFGNAFTIFYDPKVGEELSRLLRDHLLIAADLVLAVKRQDGKEINEFDIKWHKNADDIAEFLNSINPNWDKQAVKQMLYSHLALTKDEAISILNNDYAKAISLFDEIENQALMMADIFTSGIAKQFPNMITN